MAFEANEHVCHEQLPATFLSLPVFYTFYKNYRQSQQTLLIPKSVNTSFTPIMTISVVSFFTSAFFIGFGPAEQSLVFLAIAFGSAVSLLTVTSLLGPTFFAIRKGFNNVSVKKEHKVEKQKNSTEQHKSAEPEEAIFIGIND